MFAAINPLLRRIIKKVDVECAQDGSLLIKSLKRFLGEDAHLCRSCTVLDHRIANPFYQIGARIMRAEPRLMRDRFLDACMHDVETAKTSTSAEAAEPEPTVTSTGT